PDHYPYPYEFPGTRYGPRVPAMLISPRVPAGTVFRPEGFTPVPPYTDVTPYDHTSVIATLNDFFQTGALTDRDTAAPSFSHVLCLSDDNLNFGPASVKVPPPPALPADGLAGLMKHPTAMAKKLSLLRELFRDEIKL
ncbi:MAG TPA: alkaline phosphatase family protein, partial [Blastocatellia bacterium]|nr:alkaline phosphatase family protein [Blastocatellia bacterium]